MTPIARTRWMRRLAALAATLGLIGPAAAQTLDFDTELLAIQHAWDEASYSSANEDQKRERLEALSHRVDAFVRSYNGRAEPLIWQGIVLSSYAGAKGGLGALSLAKKARDSLLAALQANPDALSGSAYTSLGALYFKVPGFPIGFGNDRKADEYLKKALQINPEGIDPNYFYGELLFEQHKYAEAGPYLQKALAAPPRPQRPLADSGRRAEANALLERVREKIGPGALDTANAHAGTP